MRKILTSLLVIGILSSGVFSLSQAFFNDTETSTGNVLSAGAIDLKIGNNSFYNGQASGVTSWSLDDLNDKLFFNFTDIKPGDRGEDVISLEVSSNSAWACADITITENDDNTCTGPELLDDSSCTPDNDDKFDGELSQNLEFVFWLDDGNGVYQTHEQILTQGAASQALNQTFTLADSLTNNLGGGNGNPMEPNHTYYLGKVWCFGDLAINEGNITCNGAMLDNATQTDILKGNISFYAIQARHNENFVCGRGRMIETLEVPSTSSAPTISSATLSAGKNYLLEVEGSYIYMRNCGISRDIEGYPHCIADAEWSYRPPHSYGPGWLKGEGTFPSVYGLDLMINGGNIDWGDLKTSHKYSTTIAGNGAQASFLIWDDVYADNSGSLSVKIYESP